MERRVVLVVCLLVVAGCAGGVPGDRPGVDAAPNATTSPGADAADTGTSVTAAGANGTLAVHFVDVGQASAVLVVGPTGETLLYDSGDWRDDGATVRRYLDRLNVTRVDYLVTSHADADHVGGHAAVIEEYETERDGVGAVYDPGFASASRAYERYLDAVERHGVPLYRTRAGDEIPLAGANVTVLSPPAEPLADGDRNANSLVLRVAHGNVTFLLTGDADRTAERTLVRSHDDLDATVLAAGHHGSDTSTSEAFLAATRPEAVVISSAYDSPYGHPHREVLARLAARDVPTFWTAVHGTVRFESDGRAVTVYAQAPATTDPERLRDAPPASSGVDAGFERVAHVRGGALTRVEPTPVAADGGTTSPPTPTGTATGDAGTNDGRLVLAGRQVDAPGNDHRSEAEEYVAFRNAGDAPLDLTGWTVADAAGHVYRFPDGFTLSPGATVTLHTGDGADTTTDLYWGSDRAIWNNDGDAIVVRDADGDVALEVTY